MLALDLDLLHLGGLLLPAQGAHLVPEAVLPHLRPGAGAGASSTPDTYTLSHYSLTDSLFATKESRQNTDIHHCLVDGLSLT